MTISRDPRVALAALDARLTALLPPEYQNLEREVAPVSMGSAPLKMDADGDVAWDEMWGSFCDLAMAGGPPHKGLLLEPGSAAAIAAARTAYSAVVHEISRGIWMVSRLEAGASADTGWIRVECQDHAMAGWLLRAIVMENVAVRSGGSAIGLPAAPSFRLEKEIKNVITVVAKTTHYWLGHMLRGQQRAIGRLLATMEAQTPLVEPAVPGEDADVAGEEALATRIAAQVARDTGLPATPARYFGWLGLECPSVRVAIWLMRALVVSNVLARREGTTLFVPLNPDTDPDGQRVTSTLADVHRLAVVRLQL
ncbi:MAG: hypothetical protein ABIX28_15295 [Vicinamibacterales bacterium]